MNKQQQAVLKEQERQRRVFRRAVGSKVWEWPCAGPAVRKVVERTRQRTAMEIAAFLLDEAHECELADWLLCAVPQHAKEVAAGVAAIALRENLSAVWDMLAAADAMDLEQAAEWYETEGVFVWEPDPTWLTRE